MSTLLMRVGYAAMKYVIDAQADGPLFETEPFTQRVGPLAGSHHDVGADEVVYVLEGGGFLEIDGERAPLRAGSCVHLPARLVHCLANTGDSELRLLGVFRPAGSPAEAYYPDGTPAVMKEET